MSTAAAYDEVLRITRREAKNFAYGIMVLPRPKRRAIAAIYAFARRVDDVADGDLATEEKRAALERLRAGLDGEPADPVFVALADARERFGIPREPLEAFIDGGLQDLEQATYADFDELRGYCEKVAGAVGLACVPVYGSDDTEHAMTLGIALQLINIIRDVAEDQALGRVYLPQDELNAFGVEEVGGVRKHAIAHYLDWASNGGIDVSDMLTHKFTIDTWRDAFGAIARQGETGTIKVAFDYR